MIRKPIKLSGPKKPKKVVKNPRVERTRNGGTQTQNEHMGRIRSALRQLSQYWKPIAAIRKAALRGYISVKGKRVPQYQCSSCLAIVEKGEVDHLIPAGSLRSYEDLPAFCTNLFCEDVSQLIFLCKPCHKEKTHQ